MRWGVLGGGWIVVRARARGAGCPGAPAGRSRAVGCGCRRPPPGPRDRQWIDGVCESVPCIPSPSTSPAPIRALTNRSTSASACSTSTAGTRTAIPRPAPPITGTRPPRTGHNVADDGSTDTGVVIDFLLSSEHSENEKIPITTAATCIDVAGTPTPDSIPPPCPGIACSNIHRKATTTASGPRPWPRRSTPPT